MAFSGETLYGSKLMLVHYQTYSLLYTHIIKPARLVYIRKYGVLRYGNINIGHYYHVSRLLSSCSCDAQTLTFVYIWFLFHFPRWYKSKYCLCSCTCQVRVKYLDSLIRQSPGVWVPKEHPRSGNCSTSAKKMTSDSMSLSALCLLRREKKVCVWCTSGHLVSLV